MAQNRKLTVGVVFGGRSVEHDVSIVTAQQIMDAFDTSRYTIVPIYISREGRWYTGEPLRKIDSFKNDGVLSQEGVESVILSPDVRHHGLILNPMAGRFSKSEVKRIDVMFPAIHGTHGEDGTLQGLFELADIPYVGFGTMGSALSNDKIITKQILTQNNIPVVEGLTVTRDAWRSDSDTIVEQVKARFDYPVFVKPVTLGSSIGVGRADNDDLLRASLDVATNFDRRVLVEGAVQGIEINCSVMGYGDDIQTSVLEQPLSWADFLAFEDKYLRGGDGMKSADRIIPAPISDSLTAAIQQASRDAYQAVDGRGICRIDFLVEPETETFYLNEINSLPGSLALYLWQETGMSAADVVHKLVELAQDAYADKRRNVYDYKTNLVDMAAGRGLKGAKGGTKAVRS